MRRWRYVVALIGVIFVLAVLGTSLAWTPLTVADDPLVRMPGTQPGDGVSLEAPTRCFNCHEDLGAGVTLGFDWKGSMMAQSARDFLFYSCMAVAGQDSIWAIGRPNAVDICERCHYPKGWLEGRSDPTNASAMTGADFDGVQCDFCHTSYDPFYQLTYTGDPNREGSDWLNYWDETNLSVTPSQLAADATYDEDHTLAAGLSLFNGLPFYSADLPFSFPSYFENGGGQYYVSTGSQKRASFADAAARHQMLYSRYHKSRYFCGTCHDVSNPALANLAYNGTPPGDGTTVLPTETDSAFSYYHVERTFSEFMLSDYGLQGGAPGIGPYAPGVFNTSYSNNYIAKCQDCHMRDVSAEACNKTGAPLRTGDPATTESVEHPYSGMPSHDLTGGNIWVSAVLASAISGSANYDATNDSLLHQGAAVLTLDLSQGEGIDPVALLAGRDRAQQELLAAASLQNASYDCATGTVSFRVQNQTGHKLISGFPEGRRMFVNIRAYSQGSLVFEVNPYDATVGTLKGLDPGYSPNSPPLSAGEAYVDELVYETHPTSALTGEAETFHFALATGRYKDNRIPPKGFRIAEAAGRLSEPVWHGASAPGYFTAAEYAGGYDDVSLALPVGADTVEVRLYYQTTSREYVEFLRDEINGTGRLTLPAGAYIIQTDPFFSGFKAWGNTVWQLWDHNKNLPGASPFLMTSANVVAQDEIPPEIVCPPDVDAVSPDCQPVAVDIGMATATDNCGVASLTNNAPALFPPGATIVTWTACDAAGNCTDCTQTVNVNCAPTCAINYDPAEPTTEDVITFNSGAADPDGTVASVSWDFGDGGTASGDPAAHQYAEPATYTVCVTVIDDQGAQATCCVAVTVQPANEPPTCCFTYAPAAPECAEPVQFTDCSSDDGTIVSWAWDFGDGGSSSAQSPSHEFAVGIWHVCLTVTDDGGLSATCCQDVTVADTTAPVMVCPPDAELCTDPGSCEACGADIGTATATDECDAAPVITNDAPECFPLGVTVVTWTACDASGNCSSCQQNVTVNDCESPTIVCPADIDAVSADCQPVEVDIGTATASDNCGVASLTNDAPDLFPPGVTAVTWTACDAAGNCTDCTQTVSVNCAPTCAISYDPAEPTTEDVITFNSGAADPDGTIASVSWDFGDDSTDTGDPVTHQYAEAGTYTVCATVTDDEGAQATCCVEVTVETANEPPVCCFTAPPAAGTGEVVSFTDCSSDDGTIVSWSWDFGDGGSSSAQNASHQFAAEGSYEVCLTVTDDGGLSATCCASIDIAASTTVSFNLTGPAWHMISLPCEPVNPDPAAVFDELDPYGTPSLLSGNLHRYIVNQGYLTWYSFAPGGFGGPLRVGEGYWLYVFQNVTISYEAVCTSGEYCIEFPEPGWYIIGHPHTGPVDVRSPGMQAELGASGRVPYCGGAVPAWMGDPLIGYDPAASGYDYVTCGTAYPGHTLEPFQGYWADVREGGLIVCIPPP